MVNYKNGKNGGKKKAKRKAPKAPRLIKVEASKPQEKSKGEIEALRSASRPIPKSKVDSAPKPLGPPKRKKPKKKKIKKTLTKKTKGSASPSSYAGNKRTPGASGKLYSPSGSM